MKTPDSWIGMPVGTIKFSKRYGRWYKNTRTSDTEFKWVKISRCKETHAQKTHRRKEKKLKELMDLCDTPGYMNGNNSWVVRFYGHTHTGTSTTHPKVETTQRAALQNTTNAN
jgi:hypothetical protein